MNLADILLHPLVMVGLTGRNHRGEWHVPISIPSRQVLRYYWLSDRRPYRFRNLKHVTSRIPGRLLSWRWGGGWLGFEIGDRGSLAYRRCLGCGSPLHITTLNCVHCKH